MNNIARGKKQTMDVRDAQLFAFLIWLGNNGEKELDFLNLLYDYAIVVAGFDCFVEELNPTGSGRGLRDKLPARLGHVRRTRREQRGSRC